MELHGGSIEARSPGPGQGATFTVRPPISPLVSTTLGVSPVPATKPQADATAPPVGLDGLRVLVVGRRAGRRAVSSSPIFLEMSGIEVRAAATVAPHVIVSDIVMPDEDGHVLIRRIRTLAAEDKKSIPVIALTAFARNEDRTRALVEGRAHAAERLPRAPPAPRTAVAFRIRMEASVARVVRRAGIRARVV